MAIAEIKVFNHGDCEIEEIFMSQSNRSRLIDDDINSRENFVGFDVKAVS